MSSGELWAGELPYSVRVVILVFLAAWTALLFHELAHALTAHFLGVRVWSLIVGVGPLLWGGMVGGCRVRVGLLPLHGEVRLYDEDAERLGYRGLQAPVWRFEWHAGSWRAPLISASGAVANLLAAMTVLAYWLWMPRLTPSVYALSLCMMVVNFVMYLNLMPIRGLDGWRLAVQVAAWRRGPALTAPAARGPGQIV